MKNQSQLAISSKSGNVRLSGLRTSERRAGSHVRHLKNEIGTPVPRDFRALLPSQTHPAVDWRIILSAIALTLLAAQSSHAGTHAQTTSAKSDLATSATSADRSMPLTGANLSQSPAGLALGAASNPSSGPTTDVDDESSADDVDPGTAVSKTKMSAFAQTEIRRYDEVISAVTERAENETNPALIKKYGAQLKRLTKELDQVKKAQAQWKREEGLKSEPFARENLKESIQALQESGTHLVEDLIAADRQADENAHDARTAAARSRAGAEGRSIGQD